MTTPAPPRPRGGLIAFYALHRDCPGGLDFLTVPTGFGWRCQAHRAGLIVEWAQLRLAGRFAAGAVLIVAGAIAATVGLPAWVLEVAVTLAGTGLLLSALGDA
jgi:hypothetical protein